MPTDTNNGVALFTEAQLKELETVFGLKREEMLPVLDGLVTKTSKVWWRGEDGPELITAGDQWRNIREYPEIHSLKKPKGEWVYTKEAK